MHDVQPVGEPVRERGLLTVPDEVWQLAVRRAAVIGPLAAAPSVGAGAVDAAATELGVSRRQVYLLLGRWRRRESGDSRPVKRTTDIRTGELGHRHRQSARDASGGRPYRGLRAGEPAAAPVPATPVRQWPGMTSEYAWVRPHSQPSDAPTTTRAHQIGRLIQNPDNSRGGGMTTASHLFLDGDVVLAARIHRATDDPLERQPGVVVMGSWLTVKEQMADHYAAALADRGYTAMTFDFAGFGASGGALRQTEMPARKMRNIAAAVHWFASLSMVDRGGIGAVAVCASAQYTLAAVAAGVPIRSLASVAGWFHDAASIGTFYGGADGIRDRLGRAARATEAVLHGNDPSVVPAYAPGDDRAGMFIEMPYYGQAERGAVPSWRNEMTELSWAHWLTRAERLLRSAAADGVRRRRDRPPLPAHPRCH